MTSPLRENHSPDQRSPLLSAAQNIIPLQHQKKFYEWRCDRIREFSIRTNEEAGRTHSLLEDLSLIDKLIPYMHQKLERLPRSMDFKIQEQTCEKIKEIYSTYLLPDTLPARHCLYFSYIMWESIPWHAIAFLENSESSSSSSPSYNTSFSSTPAPALSSSVSELSSSSPLRRSPAYSEFLTHESTSSQTAPVSQDTSLTQLAPPLRRSPTYIKLPSAARPS